MKEALRVTRDYQLSLIESLLSFYHIKLMVTSGINRTGFLSILYLKPLLLSTHKRFVRGYLKGTNNLLSHEFYVDTPSNAYKQKIYVEKVDF